MYNMAVINIANISKICIHIQHNEDKFITLYKMNYSTMLIKNNESTVYN